VVATESLAGPRDAWRAIAEGKTNALLRQRTLPPVEADPHRPGPARGRLVDEQIPVWAIVGQIRAISGVDDLFAQKKVDRVFETIVQVADDYDVSIEAILAAVAYYRMHREAVDALLQANAAVR
jgi:uncharacterized protein (DUF433 family)